MYATLFSFTGIDIYRILNILRYNALSHWLLKTTEAAALCSVIEEAIWLLRMC